MAPNSKLSLITLISILISFLTIVTSQSCEASGYLRGIPGTCHVEYDSNYCCKANKLYPQYHCSPHVTKATHAIMTLSNFNGACDGGCTPGCDGQYHADTELVVALSTGWYGGGRRCLNSIRINANGRSAVAKVVDECDSVHGCDVGTDFQPPCRYDDVDASPAVWKALGIASTDVGEYEITWSDV